MTDETKPHFDGTINLGHIISVGAILVCIGGGWYVFDHRLTSVEKQLERLSNVIVEAVRVDERFKAEALRNNDRFHAIERRLDRVEPK